MAEFAMGVMSRESFAIRSVLFGPWYRTHPKKAPQIRRNPPVKGRKLPYSAGPVAVK